MKSAITVLLLSVLLTGCAQELSDERIIKDTQPDLVEYDKATQKKAAAEMDKFCGMVPTICEMLVDYGVMRDQVRAARGQKVDVTR